LHGFFDRRAVRVVGVLAILVVVVVFLFLVLNWYVAPTKPSERKDLILAVAQILGGTALLSGLYFTWRTMQVNREGQITERFTRAIDQIGKIDDKGNKLLEVRIGGIYALERIARESEKDYSTIMEILGAYIRQNAPWPPRESHEEDNSPALPQASEGDVLSSELKPSQDVSTVLKVLWRRDRYLGNGEESSLDLPSVNLRGAAIANTHLEQTLFNGSNFEKAFLQDAYLQLAFLSETNFEQADLERANLQRATLHNANLRGANLRGANLEGVSLLWADLQGADLEGAVEITNEELHGQCSSLEGATMPNGQKYEDWLKDKEGSGNDVENE